MTVMVKLYVDQRIRGKVVSTQFDTNKAAVEYAAAVGGKVRKPVEAKGTMGEKLFEALKR